MLHSVPTSSGLLISFTRLNESITEKRKNSKYEFITAVAKVWNLGFSTNDKPIPGMWKRLFFNRFHIYRFHFRFD